VRAEPARPLAHEARGHEAGAPRAVRASARPACREDARTARRGLREGSSARARGVRARSVGSGAGGSPRPANPSIRGMNGPPAPHVDPKPDRCDLHPMRRPARNRLLDGLHGNVAKVLCLVVLTAGAAAIQPAVAAHQPARRTTRPSLAAGVLARLNRIRQSNGLAPLAVSPQLVAAARQHSVEMLADGYFGHDSQNGSPFWKRVWRYYGRAAVGENLLWAM